MIMKVKELKEILNESSSQFKDFDDWEIFSEDSRLFTYNDKDLNENKIYHNVYSQMTMTNALTKSILNNEKEHDIKVIDKKEPCGISYFNEISKISFDTDKKVITLNIKLGGDL